MLTLDCSGMKSLGLPLECNGVWLQGLPLSVVG